MKPDSTTIDRDSLGSPGVDASNESRGSSIDLSDSMDLSDLSSVAVLCVPAGSRVALLGLGDGSVARRLSARMCRVWGVDNDSDAARASAPWCERMIDGELATLDRQAALGGESADAVLILGGLGRSPDPASVLGRITTLLAPGGRIVLAVPDAVDRPTAYDLLRRAGLAAMDEIPIREPREHDATRGAVRFLLIAAPATELDAETMPVLAGAAMEQLQRLERKYRRLDLHNQNLESELADQRRANVELRAALDEARDWHRRSAEAVSATADSLRKEMVARERLGQQLGATAEELEQCRVERRFLRDDLAVKDAYLASLREENARHVEADRQRELALREQQLEQQRERQQWEAAHEARRLQQEHEHDAHRRQWDDRARALTCSLDTAVSERDAEANRAMQLEAANEQLRRHIASEQAELHRVHVAVAETLAQPRYVLADRVNAWARRISVVHRPLKRFWLSGRRN